MGKKAKLYLLVIVNLAVWGYVGYKVYGALQGDEDPDFSSDQTAIKKMEPVTKADSIQLSLNYEDPFLKHGNFSSGRPKQMPSSTAFKAQPTIKTPVVKTVTTPTAAPVLDIKYLGLIKNSAAGGAITALLSINGRSSFIKQNEVIEGFVVKEISAESILLLKGKEKILIRK